MNEWKPEVGEMIIVRDCGVWQEEPREFVWSNGDKFWCVHRSDPCSLFAWSHVKPIPKKQHIPFTFETFPKGGVWVSEEPERYRSLVIGLNPSSIDVQDRHFSWEKLLEAKISTDGGITWVTGGLEVDA